MHEGGAAPNLLNRVSLRTFVRQGLDVLFLALNPPAQSNAKGHYFSGDQSRFFDLLFMSGLITEAVPKSRADAVVFGTTSVNYNHSAFGVTDLVSDFVQTHSGNVRPLREHVKRGLDEIRHSRPRFVCVIHSKARHALIRYGPLTHELECGMCGPILPACNTQFVLNYFPNGNPIPDAPKLELFSALKKAL
jgi:G:T/U-mismatch repair DNA glycosylase